MTVGTCILLLLLTVGCLVYAAPIHTALAEGVFLCLQVILPSLYAMMIAAQLLIRTNAHTLLLKPLHRFTQNVLRIPDVCLAIFLLSQIGGYPIGAKLLDNELQKGTLRPKQAAILSGICFGSGPASLFGTLSAQAGTSGCWLLFGSILLANFSLFIIANRFPPTPTGENARGNCHAIWCSFVTNVCDDFIFPLFDDRCTGFRTVCPTHHSAAMGIPKKYRRGLAVR